MAALENFQQSEGENKLMILGDMFELGAVAEKEHQNITNFLENNPFGKVLLVGSNFYKTKTTAAHIAQFESYDDLKDHLGKNGPFKTFMLIKGSRGMALERILDIF